MAVVTWRHVGMLAGLMVAVATLHSAVMLPLVSEHVAEDIRQAVREHAATGHPGTLSEREIQQLHERLVRIEAKLDELVGR